MHENIDLLGKKGRMKINELGHPSRKAPFFKEKIYSVKLSDKVCTLPAHLHLRGPFLTMTDGRRQSMRFAS